MNFPNFISGYSIEYSGFLCALFRLCWNSIIQKFDTLEIKTLFPFVQKHKKCIDKASKKWCVLQDLHAWDIPWADGGVCHLQPHDEGLQRLLLHLLQLLIASLRGDGSARPHAGQLVIRTFMQNKCNQKSQPPPKKLTPSCTKVYQKHFLFELQSPHHRKYLG